MYSNKIQGIFNLCTNDDKQSFFNHRSNLFDPAVNVNLTHTQLHLCEYLSRVFCIFILGISDI